MTGSSSDPIEPPIHAPDASIRSTDMAAAPLTPTIHTLPDCGSVPAPPDSVNAKNLSPRLTSGVVHDCRYMFAVAVVDSVETRIFVDRSSTMSKIRRLATVFPRRIVRQLFLTAVVEALRPACDLGGVSMLTVCACDEKNRN